VAELEAGRTRRPRDGHDVLVVAAVISAALGTRFTSAEVWRHAKADPLLREALAAGFVDNAVALGLLFRRMRGVDVDSWALERTSEWDREGVVWRLRGCDGEPSQIDGL
jgi:hypothetical protein